MSRFVLVATLSAIVGCSCYLACMEHVDANSYYNGRCDDGIRSVELPRVFTLQEAVDDPVILSAILRMQEERRTRNERTYVINPLPEGRSNRTCKRRTCSLFSWCLSR